MEVSKEIRDGIDRLIEQFQLEGRNILELPEQLAAALAVGVRRKMEKPPIIKVDSHGEEDEDYSTKELYGVMTDHRIWLEILEEVSEVKSRQLRRELLRLAKRLLKAYPKVSLVDFSPLWAVMEYLLDAIFRVGNQNCFFTPVNIAHLMIGLVQPNGGTLWDPACGSGTFLVESVRDRPEWCYPSKIYGTDINEQMSRIARINAFFHGIKNVQIVAEDALEEQRRFDVIVANPPVTTGRGTDKLYGHIAPTSLLHLQFLQMIPERLHPGGRAAVLVNESVLFSQKKTETRIREALVEQYGLWAVISLPKGAFAPYTNAKSSILLFGGRRQTREETFGGRQQPQREILFYELHHLGYTLDKKRTKTAENDIPDAVAVCAENDFYLDRWRLALQEGSAFNADGIVTPENWQEERFWFADTGTLRENGYVLLPDRYRPRKRQEQGEQEDYRELLEKLFRLEQEAGKQMKELRNIFQGDWM